jgi:hypothetical protein
LWVDRITNKTRVAEATLAGRIGVEVNGMFDENDLGEEMPDRMDPLLEEQPADSDAILERRGDELTITLPPAGVWRGSKGLLSFAIVWNAFMAVVTTAIALGGDWQHWVPLVVGCVFWLIGAWVLLVAINMGRKRAIIDVVGGTLLISVQGVFGTKQHEVRAGEIKAICMGPSGTTVNGRAINELQIHRKAGRKLGLLSQRADGELAWIASLLQKALGVGP